MNVSTLCFISAGSSSAADADGAGGGSTSASALPDANPFAAKQLEWFTSARLPNFMLRRVPQQKNDYDCGLYMLEYIKRIAKHQPDLSKHRKPSKYEQRWIDFVRENDDMRFNSGNIEEQRRYAKHQIEHLGKIQKDRIAAAKEAAAAEKAAKQETVAKQENAA